MVYVRDKIDGSINKINIAKNGANGIPTNVIKTYTSGNNNVINTNITNNAVEMVNFDLVNEISNEGKLNTANIDLSRIGASANNVLEGNYVSVSSSAFSGDLDYRIRDDGTVAIIKDGNILGFTDKQGAGLLSPSKVEINNDVKIEKIRNLGNDRGVAINTSQKTNITTIIQDKNGNSINLNGTARPEDFDFKHDESKIIAAKAKNLGFTDEQIKIAIGISRGETGNYTSKTCLEKNNYGGLNSSSGYIQFESVNEGMDAFLNNLKTNYFDQGLTTVESISRKYLGYQDDGSWAALVKGCMK